MVKVKPRESNVATCCLIMSISGFALSLGPNAKKKDVILKGI